MPKKHEIPGATDLPHFTVKGTCQSYPCERPDFAPINVVLKKYVYDKNAAACPEVLDVGRANILRKCRNGELEYEGTDDNPSAIRVSQCLQLQPILNEAGRRYLEAHPYTPETKKRENREWWNRVHVSWRDNFTVTIYVDDRKSAEQYTFADLHMTDHGNPAAYWKTFLKIIWDGSLKERDATARQHVKRINEALEKKFKRPGAIYRSGKVYLHAFRVFDQQSIARSRMVSDSDPRYSHLPAHAVQVHED